MKKRYARILAATLSAAMVFTSAPASVFDTGVIEAKAAGQYADGADLKAAVKAAVEAELETTHQYDSAKKTQTNYLADIVDKLAGTSGTMKAYIQDLKLTTTSDTANVGEYAVTCTFDSKSGACITDPEPLFNDESVTIDKKLKITKKPVTDDSKEVNIGVNTGSGDTYTVENFKSVQGSGAIKASVDGTETAVFTTADTADTKVNGYKISTADINKVTNAKVADSPVKITLFKDADANLDYSGLTEYKWVDQQTTPQIQYEVEVEIVQKTAVATSELTGDGVASKVTATWGGTNIVVYDSQSSAAETTHWTLVDPEAIKSYDVGTYSNVKVQSDEHKDANTDWAHATVASGLIWNSATDRFETTVDLKINEKPLNSNEITWPDSLAAGETVAVGDDLTKLKVASTEKNGTFEVVGYDVDGTYSNVVGTAKSGTMKLWVKFVPDKNHTTGNIMSADAATVSKQSGKFVKKNCITVDAAKAVVSESDIAIALSDAFDHAEYGDKVSDVIKYITFKGQSKGTYTLSGISEGKVLSLGKNTITYKFTLDNTDDYVLFNGKSTADLSVEVNVATPVVKFVAGRSTSTAYETKDAVEVGKNFGLYGDVAVIIDAFKSDGKTAAATALTNLLDPTNKKVEYKYQWYYVENGQTVAVRGASIQDSIALDTNTLGTIQYYCVVTPTIKTKSADEKSVLETILPGTITTDKYTLVVAKTEASIDADALSYGYSRKKMRMTLSSGTAKWQIQDAKWSYKDADGTAHEITGAELDTNKLNSTVAIPDGLAAGKYEVTCNLTAVDKDGNTDVRPVYYTLNVAKAKLDNTDWNAVTIEKVTVPFGTKLSDIKIKGKDGSEKLGTYEWATPDTIVPVGEYTTLSYQVRFIPNKNTKDNYCNNDNSTDFKDYEPVVTLKVEKLTVEKATLTIKAEDVTVEVNGKVDSSVVKTVATGLVGSDTLANLGVKVEYAVASSVDTSKAGTIVDAIETTVYYVDTVNRKNVKVDKTNAKTLLDNYNIVVANGSVIVKAAAPSVTPTPAPAKNQAAAAAPKAKVAKKTVKVGKKYTFKVKYASVATKKNVKKVKWTSSKKSVATVSSKGKVTAKKAGKATIKAKIYFKDGSTKTVKFTVRVK